jgi:HAMP domain-containing protein
MPDLGTAIVAGSAALFGSVIGVIGATAVENRRIKAIEARERLDRKVDAMSRFLHAELIWLDLTHDATNRIENKDWEALDRVNKQVLEVREKGRSAHSYLLLVCEAHTARWLDNNYAASVDAVTELVRGDPSTAPLDEIRDRLRSFREMLGEATWRFRDEIHKSRN